MPTTSCLKHRVYVPMLFACSLGLVACKEEQPSQPDPLPLVSVTELSTQSIAVERSLPGRTVAYMVSDVRPQVGGIIQKRLFSEGQDVAAGEVLYQIDPRIFQAAHDTAKAQLAQAEAAVLSARPRAERYRSLVADKAVSQQDSDDAEATLRQSEAAVVAAKAALQSAKINLDYTRITAPISGRIGTSTYTPGALVTGSQENALTTIQQLDPIYVDVTQTSSQMLALRKQLDKGALKAVGGKAEVKVVLEDGTPYPIPGTLEFVGTSVDTGTGTVTLRAVIPNPNLLLLPGTYVRALLPLAINESAILVSQTSVTRNTKGEALVKLVGSDGKVVEQEVKTGDAINDQWVITEGLKAGDRLIVEGGSRVKAGDAVAIASAATVVASAGSSDISGKED